ncbi:MAG TPA: SAM-dependent methyltransferase [Thermoanaerobaculia bacterium]
MAVYHAPMTGERGLRHELRNLLQYGDLSFRDFVELALYHPEFGYYTRGASPVGKGGDFVTSPSLSPVFSYALGRLVDEFVSRAGGALSSIVDIGCGDGTLIRALRSERARFYGVDRVGGDFRTLDEVPRDGAHLIFSNELFDALPFARLVQRGEHVHELFVNEVNGELEWHEHEASPLYEDYFASHGIELSDGQFADVSLEWEAMYADVARFVTQGLIVTFDYGFRAPQLFHPRIRRFGTAAAYRHQRVTRDLLSNPGEQDLTAHINFSDLERAGEREGMTTLFFDSQAKFLLSLGITDHELFRPIQDVEMTVDLIDPRDEARRLILPDGIGEDIRVLVQGKGVPLEGWSFQKKLW